MNGAWAAVHQRVFGSTPRLFMLHTHDAEANAPAIVAAISLSDRLCISFFVEKSAISAPFAQAVQRTKRADFLWQENCLEAFIGFADGSYVEINAAPDGRYNIYRFSGYRTPDAMPPVRDTACAFSWVHDSQSVDGYDQWHFVIDGIEAYTVTQCNLTAILYPDGSQNGDTAIYYAIRHAAPPDFHDRSVWANL